ncbi:hypothetical protein DXG03_008440 [Asterophora parasitica]|uniref:ABC transmembrane type-1 domain-containing protein n=1 Tax=Asterophora parasitica TaxID=117018 RepID=A0A9P7GBV6_9AGAR|nr:hypothetical protein DXG03_008440 [Asterophora parasitica]
MADAEPWISPHYRELVLGTLLPSGFIVVSVVNDVAGAIPVKHPLRSWFNPLCAPFRNFLADEDVVDSAHAVKELRGFVPRTRILSVLAFVASAAWLARFVYGVTLTDASYALKAFVALFSWNSGAPSLVGYPTDYVSILDLRTPEGFVPPYALKEILAALTTDDRDAITTAYFWALVTFLAHLSFAQVALFQNWHTRRCYERTRGQLFCSLHYKSLRRQDITGHVREEEDGQKSADLGKIVNLMQGDAYAVSHRFWEFSGLFSSPIRLTIALVFLYKILGWSALSGVVVILLAYIANYPLATYNISITRASWKAKDTRMNVVNELLQNIRFLKFYGWGE